MENTNHKFNSIMQYSVRLASKSESELKGSGILFIKKIPKAILITAAHVMEEILKESSMFLTFFCCGGTPRTEKINISKSHGQVQTDSKPGEVFFHPSYHIDDHSKRFYYDIAIVVLPWRDWMETIYSCSIGQPTQSMRQEGRGFPLSSCEEWQAEEPFAAIENLTGTVNDAKSNTKGYAFRYHLEQAGERIQRDAAMEGFSGTGLFEIQNDNLVLTGLVSQPYGDPSAGTVLWASMILWACDIDPELRDPTVDSKRLSDLRNRLQDYSEKEIKLSRNSSLRLEKLEPMLYPDIIDDNTLSFYANDNLPALLRMLGEIDCCEELVPQNFLLIGEGGIGKTATILGSCRYLQTKPNVFAIYIPLRRIDESSGINGYILNNIFHKDEELYETLLKISQQTGEHPYRVYFLLDGFNELCKQQKKTIINEIYEWEILNNIRIVISSRRALEKDGYDGFLAKRFTMKRLPWDKIQNYLKDNKIPISNENKMSITLGIPLMLKLYVFIKKTKTFSIANNPCYRWKNDIDNPICLLWDYIQCQIHNACSLENDTDFTLYEFVAAAEYIAPFIARKMNQEECYIVEETKIRSWIGQGIELLKYSDFFKDRCESIEGHIPDIKWTCQHLEKNRIFHALFLKLNIFTLNKNNNDSNEASFVHQDFQDILNFIYIEDSLKYYGEKFYHGALTDSPLPYDLITIAAKHLKWETIQELWDHFRTERERAGNYGIRNLLELLKRIKNNNLSQIDFSGADLCNASFSGTVLSTKENHPSFIHAVIGEYTFQAEGHSAPVTSVDFDPIGGKFVSASYDKTLRIWTIEKKTCLAVLRCHTHYVRCVAWSPDNGKWIASGGDDRRLILWDIHSYLKTKKESFFEYSGHEGWIFAVDWSKDGKMLASGDSRGVILLWRIAEKDILSQINWKKEQGSKIQCLLWNPLETNILGAGFEDGTFHIWNIQTDKKRLLYGFAGKITTAAWSCDGKMLAICDNSEITIWDFSYIWKKPQKEWEWKRNKKYCRTVITRLNGNISKIIWTDEFIIFSENKTLHTIKSVEPRLDNTSRRTECIDASQTDTINGHVTYVNDIAWTPHEASLLSCAEDGSLRLWSPRNNSWNNGWDCNQILEGNSLPVRCVSWAPNNQEIAAGYDDNKLRIWNVTHKRCHRIFEGHDKRIKCVEWFGTHIASGSNDNTVRLWNVETEECTINGSHKGPVNCLKWMPDGHHIISGSDDHSLCIWNYITGEKLWLKGHTDSVYCADVSPDGMTIVSGSNDRTLRFWNSADGKEYVEKRITSSNPSNHSLPIRGVSWSPDKNLPMIISASNDMTLRRWNVETQMPWPETPILKQHRDFVYCISWNPLAEYIVSGSTDNTLWIWNAETGKAVCHLEGHTNYAHHAAWSTDGKYIASASCDGTIRIWNAENPSKTYCEKILTALPFINIIDCNFTHAEFSSSGLKNKVEMNGGIV